MQRTRVRVGRAPLGRERTYRQGRRSFNRGPRDRDQRSNPQVLVVGLRATEQDITPAARQQDPAATEYATAVRRLLIELVCGLAGWSVLVVYPASAARCFKARTWDTLFGDRSLGPWSKRVFTHGGCQLHVRARSAALDLELSATAAEHHSQPSKQQSATGSLAEQLVAHDCSNRALGKTSKLATDVLDFRYVGKVKRHSWRGDQPPDAREKNKPKTRRLGGHERPRASPRQVA